MKLEGFGMGGRPRSTPQEMQEAKDMTRKKIEKLGIGSRSTARTREISNKKTENLLNELEYNKLVAKFVSIADRLEDILKSSKNNGRLDKTLRDEMKNLKKEKKEIEEKIANLMGSDFWLGDHKGV